RVRKLLAQTQARSTQSDKPDLVNGKGSDKEKLRALERSIARDAEEERGRGKEEVVLKATNRAIEKALGLGLFFQGQEDLVVRLRTGTVGAVDDVVEKEMGVGKPRRKDKKKGKEEKGGGGKGDEEVKQEAEGQDLPETQIRKVSVLEVAITLK
ncbi:MAG: hypothetical protein Q9210_007613, partial [Variospora velana]